MVGAGFAMSLPRLAAESISKGFPERIQNGRWDELDAAGFDDDLPPGAMYVAVMGRAEQNTITQRCLVVIDPMPHMMCITSRGRSIASREHTAAISGDQCPTNS